MYIGVSLPPPPSNFRWDYVDRMSEEEVPNLKGFLSGGARAEYVQTIFPSMSWPSWTTIVTGDCYE